MTFTREQANDLDRYLTREPPDGPMWCKTCACDSDDCEFPDEHDSEWISYEERNRDMRADHDYDAQVDAEDERDT